VIEGVIKRSRIKTELGVGGPNSLYLNVYVFCTKMTTDRDLGYAVDIDITYGDTPVLFDKLYGSLLVGNMDDKQYFLNYLQKYTEEAVTDFVEVNFLSN
jgi:hypothetical protein